LTCTHVHKTTGVTERIIAVSADDGRFAVSSNGTLYALVNPAGTSYLLQGGPKAGRYAAVPRSAVAQFRLAYVDPLSPQTFVGSVLIDRHPEPSRLVAGIASKCTAGTAVGDPADVCVAATGGFLMGSAK
jgi:hypothetical protein